MERVRINDFYVGRWLVQPSLNQIVDGAHTVRIPPKYIDVLVVLAEHPGVRGMLKLPGEKCLVRLHGSRGWIRMTPQGNGSVGNAAMKVAHPRGGKMIHVDLIDDAAPDP